MAKLAAQALLYLPPLLLGLLFFRKMKKKYARPMDQGVDSRIYVYTALATCGCYAVYILLLALVLMLTDYV